ncbi:hypothetical protein B296_00022199 [Ensete ventricosum]|uniref:Uncharacterized protein n=1 Tax=Ensete ventricosum TaxID=4639 RepID=A0A426XX33_ENSVE|nr:hypothetical protein B296_00022199 [Ensete ventricosum]
MRSCYIFTARRRGGQERPAPMQGRPPTARLAIRGSKPWLKPLVGATSNMRNRPRAWLAPARATPASVGVVPAQGGTAHSRGVAQGLQHLPQGRLPMPTACSTAACVGQRWRGVVRVRERARASF